jgi:hypothetical protein
MEEQTSKDEKTTLLLMLGRKAENTPVGIRHADHATPLYPQTLALTSPTSGGRSVMKLVIDRMERKSLF